MSITPIKPAISAPGWGTNLHTATTVPERIERLPGEIREGMDNITRPIQEEMRWFDRLSPADQVRQLQRMFGG